MTATKTVTATATITWNGPIPAPKKITVLETSQVSWSAEIHRANNGITIGTPPVPPSGSVSGICNSGLPNQQTTLTPDPQTTFSKGESVTGRRVKSYDVGADGVLTLPSVTLSAQATATSSDIHTTGGAIANCASYGVSVIEILRDGASLAGDNYKSLPGQKINLTIGGATSDYYEWEAPEKTFYRYDETLASNQLLETLEMDLSEFHFYWTEGKDDDRTVKCSITVEGLPVTVEGVIKVFKPQSTFVGKGGAAKVTGLTLTVELEGADPLFPHGMAWDTTAVTVPFSSGIFGFFQLGDVYRAGYILNQGGGSYAGGYRLPDNASHGLDGGAPYAGFTRTTSQIVGRPLQDGQVVDSTTAGDNPRDGLYIPSPPLNLKKLVIDDAFTTWLMFKPTGTDSCYVPLKKFSWSWSATAIRATSGQIEYAYILSSTPPGDKTGSDTTEFPQWNSAISVGATWEPF